MCNHMKGIGEKGGVSISGDMGILLLTGLSCPGPMAGGGILFHFHLLFFYIIKA